MRVVEIRTVSEWQRLRPAWDSLLRQSASDSIFLTWCWMESWWAAYGEHASLRLWAAYDENGALRGVAPLRATVARGYGRSVPALGFIGDNTNDSDYLDFIAASGYEREVMSAFAERWNAELGAGAVLLLNEIPQSSPNLCLLKEALEARNSLMTESDVRCGVVQLPGTWDEYLSILQPRFRTKVRSVLRNLEARGDVQFGFCQTSSEIERMLPILFDLHTRRWAEDGKPGVFAWDRKREFYRILSERLLQNGALRFSWLEWRDRILACQYGFVYGQTYSQLQEGYEPASAHWNVGIGLRAWSIREFIRTGIRTYDFLGGMGRHKSDWGAEVKNGKRIQAGLPNLTNRLVCRGPAWELRARESVASLIPPRIMALRTRSADRRDPGNRPVSELARKVAARCYIYSGFSRIGRVLRETYQGLPDQSGKLSWKRRDRAAARVFCYHRVNEDDDPFFPAISPRLFEEQIRFVSSHYRVVTLDEMLLNLDDGPAEPVIAITFDDGYEDNYRNAFPILQRYGVPATIFVATGMIDSGEELWFEQLARALQLSGREFLDAEIDVPRRLPLRTLEDRLHARDTLFRILRELPEHQRRECLAMLLRDLGPVRQNGQHRQMLTWDQIRSMKAGGIDFGGHTVTHPFLSKLSPGQAAWEVRECKRRIEDELQSPVSYFAYPNGKREDFGEWNKDVLRDAGYRASMTTIWGLNYGNTDRMELRRSGPWETDPALFATKLDWYNLINS
jgi:peptidoglycan/xylan/chitin deacetylase (PgdA/CDA1 family)/CelD/BcsL family acetyltransferase involved in cellulose biosynthesis